MELYANEVPVSIGLVEPWLRPGARVLEVGAGLCLASLFLKSRGVDVVALEPVGEGFGFFAAAGEELLSAAAGAGLRRLPIRAGELRPASHGFFDLIFSVDALEHMSDLDADFSGMASVLAPGGRMLHLCPNYAVPYEPHFGIPLVPFFPGWTKFLFPRAISRGPAVWHSLNFVTSGRLRSLARRHGLGIELRRGVMHDYLLRLDEDPIFSRRQGGGFVRGLSGFLKASGLRPLLRRLPPGLATPMVAVIGG